ncbi:uncharacterized protein G2W53_007115 [Senna tora]|uniref:Uncharacterized protein n=1 Tax=Senna tora TaxID=362788 RepID=A0A834X717_9FABA|nr:uncharacterized protein G2W53_007115 [Senna tora]
MGHGRPLFPPKSKYGEYDFA